MDFTNHPLNKQSIVDNRQNKTNTTISIIEIDKLVNDIRLIVSDDSVGEPLVAKALKYLGEAQVRNIADYASRKATNHPGRAFVKICVNELNKRGV